jgi:hypothetical protein
MELLGLMAIGLLILFIRSFFRGSSSTASRQSGWVNIHRLMCNVTADAMAPESAPMFAGGRAADTRAADV